jgi:phosphatidylserine decarboxylase
MHPEGRRFVLFAAALAAAAACFWLPLLFPGLLLTYGVYLFFRDPERVPPADPRTVVSPADGIVCLLSQVPLPPELLENEGGPQSPGAVPVWRVSVFMSVLDVHVNRAPAAGTVVKTRYIPGKFFNASLDKASEGNERMLYLMRTEGGLTLAFVQIAGLVARRIVRFAEEGRLLARGERFGLIRFGSRVDVYLPPGVEPCARVGQTMVAGETPLARLETGTTNERE